MARRMTSELGRTTDAVRKLGEAVHDAIAKAMQGIGTQRSGTAVATVAAAPASTASIVATAAAVAAAVQSRSAAQSIATAQQAQAAAAASAPALSQAVVQPGAAQPVTRRGRISATTKAMRAGLPGVLQQLQDANIELEARSALLATDTSGYTAPGTAIPGAPGAAGMPLGAGGSSGMAKVGRARAEQQERQRLVNAQHARYFARYEAYSLTTPAGAQRYLAGTTQDFRRREEEGRRDVGRGALEGSLIGSEAHRAALGAESNKGSVENLNALKYEIEAVKEKERWMKSPEGIRALEKEKELRRELARLTREEKRKTPGTDDTWKRFDQNVARTASTMSAIGVGAITSMAQVSSPVEWQTFKRSIEGIAASVGGVFAPALNEASGLLQRTADWFDTLDDGTKRWIGRITVGGVILGSFISILSRLGLTASMAGTALAWVGRTLSVGMLTSPVIAGVVGLTAVVGGLAAAWMAVRAAAGGANAEQGRGQVARQRVDDEVTRGRIRRIAGGDPRAQAELTRAGGDQAQVMEALRAAHTRAEARVTEAQGRVAREQGGNLNEQRAEQMLVEQARTRLREIRADIAANPPRQFDERQRMEREAPARAVSESFGEVQRRIEAMFGRPLTEAENLRIRMGALDVVNPLPRDAQGNPRARVRPRAAAGEERALREAQDQRDLVQETLRSLGGDRDSLRQSLKGLLPSPQMFTDVSAAGEQLALRSLERHGEQDVLLEMKRLNSIAAAVGVQLEVVIAQTDFGNLFRALTPNRR